MDQTVAPSSVKKFSMLCAECDCGLPRNAPCASAHLLFLLQFNISEDTLLLGNTRFVA